MGRGGGKVRSKVIGEGSNFTKGTLIEMFNKVCAPLAQLRPFLSYLCDATPFVQFVFHLWEQLQSLMAGKHFITVPCVI